MSSQNRGQKTVLFLTVAYFFMELFGGLYYHSIALTTDASFMAINITGQIIAYCADVVSKRKPSNAMTFGWERARVLSGLFNGVLVGFIIFYVFIQAIDRIKHPEPLEADKVLAIAAVGLLVNAFGLLQLYRYSSDLNIRGALLLILNDTLGSIGVIISAVIIRYTGFFFLDPVAGMLVGLLAALPTYFLVRDAAFILMEGNPAGIDVEEVNRFITESFDKVQHVKDTHIWGLSPDRIILATRVRTIDSPEHRSIVKSIKRQLTDKFGFSDIYIEGYEGKTLE